jgi:hypothetical protein
MAPVGVEVVGVQSGSKVAGVRSGSKVVGRRCRGEVVPIPSLQRLFDRT